MDRYVAPEGPPTFDSGSVWRLYQDGAQSTIEFRSPLYGETPYKIARVSPDLAHAEVEIRLVAEHGHDPLEFPLDELLINALITRSSGVELHACGVVDVDGKGILFAGNSGDGKTTTSRLWLAQGAAVLSDDRIILRREEGGWWMYGTPWHGEADISSPDRARLSQICLLSKSSRNEATPVAAAGAVARLFACAFPPFFDRTGLETLLATLERLCADVPVARLQFVNDASAVAFVRASPALGAR